MDLNFVQLHFTAGNQEGVLGAVLIVSFTHLIEPPEHQRVASTQLTLFAAAGVFRGGSGTGACTGVCVWVGVGVGSKNGWWKMGVSHVSLCDVLAGGRNRTFSASEASGLVFFLLLLFVQMFSLRPSCHTIA